MNKEQILKNTLKGTFYENIPIIDYQIEKTMLETVPGTNITIETIKKGELTFKFDANEYKITITDGYFNLLIKEGNQYFDGSTHYIGTRVKIVNKEYWPIEYAQSYDVTKQKKPVIYMTGKNVISR